jgi:hypothetical protein
MNHRNNVAPLAERADTTGEVVSPDQSPIAEIGRGRQNQVRQAQQDRLARPDSKTSLRPLAHPSTRLLIQLNPAWRVIDDDLQYILQVRRGKSRSKATGWMPRSFCRTRAVLLRCIREHCGLVDDPALERVRALPEWREPGPYGRSSRHHNSFAAKGGRRPG